MKAEATIIAGAGLFFFAKGAKAQTLEDYAIDSALRQQADGAILLAICDTENNSTTWNPSAVNLGPGDAARGGAYGCAQLTYLTALDIPVPELQDRWRHLSIERGELEPPRDRAPITLLDPGLNLSLAAAHVATLMRQAIGSSSRQASAQTLAVEVAARYNSGNSVAAAPSSTITTYLPRFERFYAVRTGRS